MKPFAAGMAVLLALSAIGCSSGPSAPANPEDTPVMTQEEVKDAYMKSMPPDMKKKYGVK